MGELISVIVPFHSETNELESCIASIQNQNYKNVELILVPDGAGEQSLSIAKSFEGNKVKLLDNEPSQGQSKARQRGINNAQGHFIAIQDADDWSFPNRFQNQMNAFSTNKDLHVLGSAAEIMNKNYFWEVYQNHDQIEYQCLFNNPMVHSSVLLKREVFNAFSYNSTFDTAEDYDLFSLAVRHFRFKNVPEPLIRYKLPSPNKPSALDQRMKARIIRERNNYRVPELLIQGFHHFCELNNPIALEDLFGLRETFKNKPEEMVFNDHLIRYMLKHKPRVNAFQKQRIWSKSLLMRKAAILKRLLLN